MMCFSRPITSSMLYRIVGELNRLIKAVVPLLFSNQRIQSISWLKPCSKRRDHSGVSLLVLLKMLFSFASSNSTKQYS